MRHGRAKAARKTLRFFQLHAGIKPPYNVLLDGTFLAAAVRQKVRWLRENTILSYCNSTLGNPIIAENLASTTSFAESFR